jgi:hypothetical protein
MKRLLNIFLICQASLMANGQTVTSNTSSIGNNLPTANLYISANYGGFLLNENLPNALVNYEVYLGSSKNGLAQHYANFIGGVGVAELRDTIYGFGILYTRLESRGNHNFEFNAGAHSLRNGINPIINLGYRYQKPDGGMLFKVYLATVGVGVGVGWSFKSKEEKSIGYNSDRDSARIVNAASRRALYVSASGAIFSSGLMNVEFYLGTRKLKKHTLNHYLRLNSGVAVWRGNDGGPAIGAAYTGLFGKGARHIEISAGANIAATPCGCLSPLLVPILDVGYRYQQPNGGLMYRIYLANVGIGFGVGASF